MAYDAFLVNAFSLHEDMCDVLNETAELDYRFTINRCGSLSCDNAVSMNWPIGFVLSIVTK